MDDLTFRTAPPSPSYILTKDMMQEAADRVGLKKFSPSLVADLCHYAEGGQIVPPSKWKQSVREQAIETASKSSFGGTTVTPTAERISQEMQKRMEYHRRIIDFIQWVDLGRFPGADSLEKAMSMLKILSQMKGGGAGDGAGGAGETLPIFSEESAEGVAESLSDVMDLSDSLSEEEQDMLDPDGEDGDESESDGQRSGASALRAVKIAEKLVEGSDERYLLELARTLEALTPLRTVRLVQEVPDPSGEEIRRRPIKGLHELGKIQATEWAKRAIYGQNYFNFLAVTGGLTVRERITREDKVQDIEILLDGSGSMSGKKFLKASGIVMHYLKAVIRGEARVTVSVFDTSTTIVGEAETPEEARELIKKFRMGGFKGGGTNIASAVKAAHERIEERAQAGRTWRPEVVVLTDEDSSVGDLQSKDIPGTTVHGFAMEVQNPSLVKFAQSTGGYGVDKF